ncbi:MAG: TRAP transporter large permease [Burkholderiales bacterium]|nr:TRAP transporter large permease [Burkholderiales bacterium]
MTGGAALAVVALLLFPVLLTGMPIAFSIVLVSVSYFILAGADHSTIGSTMFWFLNKSELVAIPFFILTADLLGKSRATDALVAAAEATVGHLRGGLALVAMLTTIVFSAVCGSSVATAVAVGRVMIPKMVDAGYERRFAVGMIAAAGGLGILIPPSVPLIIYATIVEISVADVFLAAFGPGLMLAAAMCAYVIWLGDRARSPEGRARPLALTRVPAGRAVRHALPVLALPFLIMGGIYSGIFTPTESAAVAAVYSAILAATIYRKPGMERFHHIAAESGNVAASILLIMTATAILSYIITLNQIPLAFREMITGWNLSPLVFLMCVNALLLVLGCFLEIISVILITVPIFLPVLKALDINLVHFAIIVVVNMELGVITPPVGMNLFAISAISRTPIQEVFKGTLPFMLIMFLMLMLFTYSESLSLALLNLLPNLR